MVFTEPSFFLFFPIFACLYFFSSGRARLWVCLTGSYFFYGWWDWRFTFIIAFLTGVNYWLGLRIGAAPDQKRRKAYVVASVATSLCVLGYFKYTNFFISSFAGMLEGMGLQAHLSTLNIILPVGISFYTFQTMSYTIDVYRRQIEAEKSLLHFAVYAAFFPQLMAGPIVRASNFLPRLRQEPQFEWDRLVRGTAMVAWGFVMKTMLADSLALAVDARFMHPGVEHAGSLLIGAVFYTFQIYGDFAGYSLIAIGLAHILGFDYKANFDRPYFSSSFSEFWRRWHISLSTWLRDYLYIPLGGNRKGKVRTYINLMLTMLLGGLWHGAAWNFVFWGFLHGAMLCVQRVFESIFGKEGVVRPLVVRILGKAAAIAFVFIMVSIAWVFFRAGSFHVAATVLGRIATQGDFSFAAVPQKFEIVRGFLLIGMVVFAEAISFKVNIRELADRHMWLYGIFIVGCLLVISLFATLGSSTFIYFQF